jgi:protein-serine/threonine kinase
MVAAPQNLVAVGPTLGSMGLPAAPTTHRALSSGRATEDLPCPPATSPPSVTNHDGKAIYNQNPVPTSPAHADAHAPRRYPTDLSNPIPEECDAETESESSPNEPLTPVSGRQSRDFHHLEHHDVHHPLHPHRDSISAAAHHDASSLTNSVIAEEDKPALSLVTAPTHQSPAAEPRTPHEPLTASDTNRSDNEAVTPTQPPSQRPRSRQYSSSSLFSRRAMSIFKRTNSLQPEATAAHNANMTSTTVPFKEPDYKAGSPDPHLAPTPKAAHSRRFSFHRSSTTTRTNTPPSPASPAEVAAPASNAKANRISMPAAVDFVHNNNKKTRAHTGLSIRDRVVNFATNTAHKAPQPQPQRTRSLERARRERKQRSKQGLQDITRQPWEVVPDAGTGMKARRLSLSLPDDFTVDIADLTKEFEYQHKFFGRHGKLGKGAASKVSLMSRKGYPSELYAVKEFRSKKSYETVDEYENKIKSEYSIAKSLHHPNVVETFRLCTDSHKRWTHVMEYCSEGDLFGLVSKHYLREESREVDRLCLFKQLCQGIKYLHANGIAHRDIKLENLLITKDSKLKITDFGVSEVFSGIHPGLREAGGQCGKGMGDVRFCKPGLCGSLPYIAPEVVNKTGEYDPRPLDVWSSAVVMIYLIFNACLWEKAESGPKSSPTYNALVNGWGKLNVRKAENPDLKDAYPKVEAFEICVKPVPLRRLLLNMLNPDPSKRPTMAEVVTNRWMKNVECCQLESYEDPVKFIDVSKKNCLKSSTGKIFCHNHLPPQATSHGLPPMPGKPGY